MRVKYEMSSCLIVTTFSRPSFTQINYNTNNIYSKVGITYSQAQKRT